MSAFLNRLIFEVKPGEAAVFELTAPLRYVDSKLRRFTIPAGFTCDLSSVPRWVRSVATPWWQSSRAGVLHDAIYRWGPEVWGIRRPEADRIYMRALIDEGVSPWRAWIQKTAVRWAAGKAWRAYRVAPAKGKGPRPPPFAR